MADNAALQRADERNKQAQRLREAELVHQMRVEGKSYAKIARALRITGNRSTALHREYLEYLRQLEVLGAMEASRAVQDERYETLLSAVWAQAMSGDLAAVAQCRQILDSITAREVKVTTMLTKSTDQGTVTIMADGSTDEYINALREAAR